jgi:hypothetical protein
MFCGSRMTAATLTWITKDEFQASKTEKRQNDKDSWKMTALSCSDSDADKGRRHAVKIRNKARKEAYLR